jgi:hypothetical protein
VLYRFAVILTILSFTGASYSQTEPELVFSPVGGVYEGGTTVTLDAGDGATIYYTTNGFRPGTGSRKYKAPIKVDGVTIIRAVAYKNGKRTAVSTNTYVCDRMYDLPVVSVVTDTANLWNYSTGIYVKGCCADTIEPYMGANFWMSWEKYANIEMYDEAGDPCFNQACGIGIFGGFSRMLPMKSLAVFARKKYGDNRFRYPIFKHRDNDKYKSFILRNSGGDFKRTHLRDAFMTQLAKPTGLAIQEYQPAVVFINGEYWGIQNIREKINEHYLKQNFGVDKDNVDILRQNGVKRHGSSANYKKLLAYLRNNNLKDDSKVDALRKFMDVDDFIRYNIAEVYSDNRDAGGNIRYWRERNDSAKWRWVFYDLDQGLGNNAPKGYKRNTLLKFTSVNNESWPDAPWSTFIIRSLLANKKLEYQYINTFADHLNTVYHPDTANVLLDSMIDVIDYEMEFHQNRWGSSYKNWKHHLNIMRTFITVRPFYCRQHIMQKFNLKDTVSVEIVHPGVEVCDIHFNSIDVSRDFKGIYFKDVPVNIEVTPQHDYEFVGWSDGSKEGPVRAVNPKGDILFKPIIQPKEKSKFSGKLIFNELCYFQIEGDSSKDWVELHNRSETSIDISGWKFTDRGFIDAWEIPNSTTVEAGGFIVLTQKTVRFTESYSADSIMSVGSFEFGLSSKGESVKLYDKEGFVVDSLTYQSDYENLPDTAFTISLSHPDSTASYQAWKVSSPSPSYQNEPYQEFLKTEADKRYWTKVFYIGGGSFFFILVAGVLFIRYSRKKRNS